MTDAQSLVLGILGQDAATAKKIMAKTGLGHDDVYGVLMGLHEQGRVQIRIFYASNTVGEREWCLSVGSIVHTAMANRSEIEKVWK